MTESIPLTPPSRASSIFLFVILVLFIGFLFYVYAGSKGATGDTMSFTGVLWLSAFAMLAAVPIAWARRRRELILTETSLVLRAGFYSRTLPLSSLQVDKVLEVSLLDRTDLTPRWRTNAIALPGYRAGWFRLRNGDKALLYMTDPFRLTYVPTREGFVLLLSTGALLEALRRRAPVTPVTPV